MRIEPARLTDAKVAFGNRVLWSGLNLIVEPGEFIAVLGPNGVGKTTLLRVLLGQIPLTAGTAMVPISATSLSNDPSRRLLPSVGATSSGWELTGTSGGSAGLAGRGGAVLTKPSPQSAPQPSLMRR